MDCAWLPGYTPQLWDALTYQWTGHSHTAVIIGVSAVVKTGNTTTWTVTIEEANAACTNRITTKQSSFGDEEWANHAIRSIGCKTGPCSGMVLLLADIFKRKAPGKGWCG